MSNQLDLPNWKPGSLIKASWLQKMVDAIRRNRILIGQNSGIEYRESPHGTLLSVKQAPRCVGITASTITAATVSSGVITYGSGTVTRQIWTYGSPIVSTASDTVTVYSFDESSIPSGTNCWIEQDQAGIWYIIPPPVAGASVYYCHFSGTLAASTGTWPSITPSSTSVTVYQAVSGSLSSIGSQTVYNFTATSFAASKTTSLGANGDGTYSVIEQDC